MTSPFIGVQVPAGRYEADIDHSSVLFRIKHLGLAWYTGRFTRLTAELEIDPQSPQAARLVASVELDSLRTEYQGSDKDWDDELAGGEQFLDARRTPLARFVSTWVERKTDDRALVHGELSLRGRTQPFAFDTNYNGGMDDHPSGKPRLGFSATGLVRRSEYGLTFGLGPRMPEEVQIIVETEFAFVSPEDHQP